MIHAGLRTLREGLLRATPATSDKTRLASASEGVTGEGRPFSLFLPSVASCSRMGLDGTGASLLGCGVRADIGRGVVKAFFRVDIGVFFPGLPSDVPGLGELVDFF